MNKATKQVEAIFMISTFLLWASAVIYAIDGDARWFSRACMGLISYGIWYIGQALQQK
jgi:hypothetical protein